MTLDRQPEELSEDELIITEEHGCDGMDEDVPEKGKLTQNFELKNFQRYFHHTESTKGTKLEADPDLENSRTVCQTQGPGANALADSNGPLYFQHPAASHDSKLIELFQFALYCKLHSTSRRRHTVQTT